MGSGSNGRISNGAFKGSLPQVGKTRRQADLGFRGSLQHLDWFGVLGWLVVSGLGLTFSGSFGDFAWPE